MNLDRLGREQFYLLAAALVEGRRAAELDARPSGGSRMLTDKATELIAIRAPAHESEEGHGRPDVRFEAMEAVRWIRELADASTAVVWADAAARRADEGPVIDRLVELGQDGCRMILRVRAEPVKENDEDGPRPLAGLERLPRVRVLAQYGCHAVAAVAEEEADERGEDRTLPARLSGSAPLAALVFVVNAPDVVGRDVAVHLDSSPEDALDALERANDELRGTNARLARAQRGSFDSGAAAILAARAREKEAREECKHEIDRWHREADRLQTSTRELDLELRLAQRRLEALRNRRAVRLALALARALPWRRAPQ